MSRILLTLRDKHPWLLLAANLAYTLAFRSATATALGVVGVLTSALLLAGPRVAAPWFRESHADQTRFTRWDVILSWLLPLLPFLALISETRIAFWRVDARGLILVSWVVMLFLMVIRRHAPPLDSAAPRIGAVALLFIGWTALFWYWVVWDAGIGRLALGLSSPDRLLMSFGIWETAPASEHLYLVWLTREDFANHQVYTNHLHPYLFAIYGWTKLVQLLSGAPMYVGRNLTPFGIALAGLVTFVTLMVRANHLPERRGALFHGTLFLTLGVFITNASFWVGFYTVNFDDVFPLIAYAVALLWACAQPAVSRDNRIITVAAAALVGAFGWIYGPVAVLALVVYFVKRGGAPQEHDTTNHALWTAVLVAITINVVAYALPRVLAGLSGYTSGASDFMFRSGLDGDTRYFQNAGQAVLQPFNAWSRTAWGMTVPFVPLLMAAWWGPWRGRTGRRRLLAPLVFLTAPYWFSVAVFPQAVSIHPYLYDHLLLQPVMLLGTAAMLSASFQRRLHGPCLLLVLLVAATLTMSNLSAIAQAAQRLIPD